MKLSTLAILAILISASLPAAAQTVEMHSGAPELPDLTGAPVSISAGGNQSSAQNPFFGGVPTGELSPGELPLSLNDAIHRGLKYNLGLLLTRESTQDARGARWMALSKLLPNVSAGVSE